MTLDVRDVATLVDLVRRQLKARSDELKATRRAHGPRQAIEGDVRHLVRLLNKLADLERECEL